MKRVFQVSRRETKTAAGWLYDDLARTRALRAEVRRRVTPDIRMVLDRFDAAVGR